MKVWELVDLLHKKGFFVEVIDTKSSKEVYNSKEYLDIDVGNAEVVRYIYCGQDDETAIWRFRIFAKIIDHDYYYYHYCID